VSKEDYLCTVKRFAAFILSIVYFVSTTGTTLQSHYCMGKLVGWSISSNKTCDKCGMEKTASSKKGCCHDEHKFVKLQGDQKAAVSFDFSKLSVVTPELPLHNFGATLISTERMLPSSNAPPRASAPSLCIANCVFRI
jgi:hypothetical protein